MLSTKLGIGFNLVVGSVLLGLLLLSMQIRYDMLNWVFSNGAVNMGILVICPGMIALGIRDYRRLMRSEDFYSMSSLPDSEREMRERLAARAIARAEQPSHLEMTWDDYRAARDAASQQVDERPVVLGWGAQTGVGAGGVGAGGWGDEYASPESSEGSEWQA